jgi:hypothetical protein
VAVAKYQKLPPPPTWNPTLWTITVTAVHGTSTPTYGFQADPIKSTGGCPLALSSSGNYDPKIPLQVCSGDIIRWSGTAERHKHDMIVFIADEILQDKASGTTASTRVGKVKGTPSDPNETETDDAKVVASASGAAHEWFVVVCNKDTGETHHGDPKIMIGK